MEKLLDTTITPASAREWALFGLRWANPLGIGLYALSALQSSGLSSSESSTLTVVAIISILSNLVILLLLLSDRWPKVMLPFSIGLDMVLAIVTVAITDLSLSWVGIAPAVIAGLYYGWQPGAVAGGVVSLGILAVEFMSTSGRRVDLVFLAFSLLVIPAAGIAAFFLGNDYSEVTSLRDQLKQRGRRAEQITRMASEYMRVVYEMTEVLSASKLDPKRVLSSAVEFAVDALKRVGMEDPLYCAVLLFADSEDGLGSMLRIARSNEHIKQSDLRVGVPGIAGTIGTTLNLRRPGLNHAPAADPELREFECFGGCNTVLVAPVGSGHEAYGVMMVASKEKDAFREPHVELIRAVANQAAASLNNARLYGSMVEQRDRLVEVEKAARAQLASELHDGPTQGVAAITMRLNYIRKLIEKKPEMAVEELFKIEDLARRTTKEIRHMLFELRPMALDQGLAAGLEQLANKMMETYEQKVEVHIDHRADRVLDSQTTQTLFSIAQETVNNARKHAQSPVIQVNVNLMPDAVVMEISDQGLGYDVDAALAAASKREGHLGLLNLQERARLAEATLELWSQPGEGSRTTVAIPLDVLRARRVEEDERAAVSAGIK